MTISKQSNTKRVLNKFSVFNIEEHARQVSDSIWKKKKNPGEEEEIEECKDCGGRIISEMSLKRRLPITKWVPTYNAGYFLRDLIAGITVGLTAIPQGIAYANVAGLDPQYGLYSTIMPCFVYIIFGGCKDLTLGPTAIMALMTYPHVVAFGPASAIMLAFVSGILIILASIFQLGFLVDFISLPVTTGFTAAAAFTIASAQIKNFFGIKIQSEKALDTWVQVISNVDKLRWTDTILGCCTVLVLFITKYLKQKSATIRRTSQNGLLTSNILWLIGLSGNAIVVISGSILAYILTKDDASPFILTGNVTGGLPSVRIPPMSFGNLTVMESISEMGSAVIAIPLISILETVAIGKAFERGNGVDATQEMIALGLSNFVGAFISSMPISGSFTRSAINNTSGVKTPLGGLYTGVLVLLALGLMTDLFYYIPKASLAGLIIMAMIFMVEYRIIGVIWRTKKSDLLPLCVSFLACLFFTIEIGIAAGIATDLCFILFFTSRPTIKMTWLTVSVHKILMVIPKQDLFFPSSAYIRELIIDSCKKRNDFTFVVIDGSHINRIDTTTAKGLTSLRENLIARGNRLILWKWNENAIRTSYNYNEILSTCFRYNENLKKVLDVETGMTVENDISTGDFPINTSSNEHLTPQPNNI